MLSFEINSELTLQLKELSNKIALKNQVLRDLSEEEKESIHQFARVSMIGASTRIENAILTDAEINWVDTLLSEDHRPTAFQANLHLIEDKLSKDRERSIEEVAGCRNMLFLIYEQAKEFLPFREADLRGLHQELLKFYPPAHYYLGKYKTISNSVVEKNAKTKTERIVFKTADPGPITEVAMQELIGWYNDNIQNNAWSIAVASEFVFRFLAIHPFQDGNGRLGRGLFLLTLLQSPDQSLSTLSRYIAIDRQIEKHKQEYYHVLQQCSGGIFHQDPKEYQIDYFLKYMIKILNLALKDIDVYQSRHAAIQKLSDAAFKVLNCFKEHPEKRLQTKDIIELTHLPRRTVIHGMNTLLKNSLIQKQGQGAGTRYQIIF